MRDTPGAAADAVDEQQGATQDAHASADEIEAQVSEQLVEARTCERSTAQLLEQRDGIQNTTGPRPDTVSVGRQQVLAGEAEECASTGRGPHRFNFSG